MSYKKSKFYIKDQRSFSQKLSSFLKKLLFWKGITWEAFKVVFFPRNFHEKYKYLGCVPWDEEGSMFKAMEPLIIFMDHKAKPWWCPRWFLRFLHLFGNNNSIVRIRNRTLSDLKSKITGGVLIWDYKTKWTWYDLRISVAGTDQMHDLADAIESYYYRQGKRVDLAQQIKDLDPNTKYNSGYSIDTLEKELLMLLNDREETSEA